MKNDLIYLEIHSFLILSYFFYLQMPLTLPKMTTEESRQVWVKA